MERELSPALAKRLAAYAATAGITLALAPESSAQVVYHDIDPDVVIEESPPNDFFDLDFDDDGVADLRLGDGGDTRYYWDVEYLDRAPGANTLNGGLGTDFLFGRYIVRLGAGYVIGPPGPKYAFLTRGTLARAYSTVGTGAGTCDSSSGAFGPFLGEEGYAGFRFVAGDGRIHYGWIRLGVSDCRFPKGTMPLVTTAFEYGYELRSNTPIAAGARSDALLDGDVNQTTFPATGGTLAYTFTVESTADEPQPLDLWIEADGPDSLALHLASGTLAPGAAVTRTVEVGVGDRVPAGAYDVRFKLGDFASRRFITFERYAMVREGGAAVAASGEGTFEGVPLAGDLFAGAAGAPGLAGTHRLSAPSPNPSEARVAFTLEVAEAQQVAVGVHDALGRRVSVLHDGPMASGAVHRLVFDGSDLPAGVYVVRAVGERFADTRVVSLVR